MESADKTRRNRGKKKIMLGEKTGKRKLQRQGQTNSDLGKVNYCGTNSRPKKKKKRRAIPASLRPHLISVHCRNIYSPFSRLSSLFTVAPRLQDFFVAFALICFFFILHLVIFFALSVPFYSPSSAFSCPFTLILQPITLISGVMSGLWHTYGRQDVHTVNGARQMCCGTVG